MKPETNDLRGLLREWRDVPAGDPALAAKVRREISGGRKATGGGLFSLRMVLAGIAAGVMCGVAMAEWRARRVDAREMPQRYVAWIDPQNAPAGTRP